MFFILLKRLKANQPLMGTRTVAVFEQFYCFGDIAQGFTRLHCPGVRHEYSSRSLGGRI